MKLSHIVGIVSVVAVFALAVTVMAMDPAPAAAKADVAKVEKKADCKAQTLCPCGKAIDKACSVEVEGCKVYCCCQDCAAKVKEDPKAALKKIADAGETAEKAAADKAAPAPAK